jgi:hypothetical protein
LSEPGDGILVEVEDARRGVAVATHRAQHEEISQKTKPGEAEWM